VSRPPHGPIEEQNSKPENDKRPYVKTPARLAAARANLQKARAVPRETVYRPTARRLAANRANLAKAKAARKKQLKEIVDRLDRAFPPLGEEISEEAVGPECICSCGSGKTFHHCCKGRKPKTAIPALDPDPPSDPPFDSAQEGRAESSREEDQEAGRPQAPRTFFRIGSPKWLEEGVDREAPDYGALEKTAGPSSTAHAPC
jgi:hypothetical protein